MNFLSSLLVGILFSHSTPESPTKTQKEESQLEKEDPLDELKRDFPILKQLRGITRQLSASERIGRPALDLIFIDGSLITLAYSSQDTQSYAVWFKPGIECYGLSAKAVTEELCSHSYAAECRNDADRPSCRKELRKTLSQFGIVI